MRTKSGGKNDENMKKTIIVECVEWLNKNRD